MKLRIEWGRPIPLKDGTRQHLIYTVDLTKLPQASGIYVFGRRFGTNFEALYVGQASQIRGRIKGQLKNLPLMLHLRDAKIGKRIVIAGRFIARPGQTPKRCLSLIERSLIRYFLAEGYDLVNKQGTHLRQHEIISSGRTPKRFIPGLMYLDKAKGE